MNCGHTYGTDVASDLVGNVWNSASRNASSHAGKPAIVPFLAMQSFYQDINEEHVAEGQFLLEEQTLNIDMSLIYRTGIRRPRIAEEKVII
jgi:hypothetical protein